MHAEHSIAVLADGLSESDMWVAHELEWLVDQGVLFDVDVFSDVSAWPEGEELQHYAKGTVLTLLEMEAHSKKLRAKEKRRRTVTDADLSEGFALDSLHRQFSVRLASIILSARHNFVACPSLSTSLPEIEFNRASVIRLLVSSSMRCQSLTNQSLGNKYLNLGATVTLWVGFSPYAIG